MVSFTKPGRKPKFNDEVRSIMRMNKGYWFILWENTKVTDEMKKWIPAGFRFTVRTVTEDNKGKYGLTTVPNPSKILLGRYIGE